MSNLENKNLVVFRPKYMGIMINQHKNPYWRNQFFGTKRCQRKLHNFLLRHLRGSLTIQTTPGIQLKNRSSFISFCPEVPNSQVKNGTTPPHLMLKFSILPTRGYTMSKPIPPPLMPHFLFGARLFVAIVVKVSSGFVVRWAQVNTQGIGCLGYQIHQVAGEMMRKKVYHCQDA